MRVRHVLQAKVPQQAREPIFDTVSRHLSNAEHVTNRQKVLRLSRNSSTSDCCWSMGAEPMVTALGTHPGHSLPCFLPVGLRKSYKRGRQASPVPQGCLLDLLSRGGFLGEKNACELILTTVYRSSCPLLSPAESRFPVSSLRFSAQSSPL